MSRRRPGVIRIRYLAVLAVSLWAMYFYWHVQHHQLALLSDKSNSLQAQLVTEQKQHQKLQNMVNEFQNSAYIERYAAEHFNLILPNQVSFTVQSTPKH